MCTLKFVDLKIFLRSGADLEEILRRLLYWMGMLTDATFEQKFQEYVYQKGGKHIFIKEEGATAPNCDP